MAQLVLADGRYAQTSEVMYSAGLPVQLIGLGIIIPIAEEMMFRGILFRRYRRKSEILVLGSLLLPDFFVYAYEYNSDDIRISGGAYVLLSV